MKFTNFTPCENDLIRQLASGVMVSVIIISKGQCSMFGANKTATATGGLLQLRALDWDVDGNYTS